MKIITTEFNGLIIIENKVFHDDRGHFLETFNEARFRITTGMNLSFVQDNMSRSVKGVLRGLHYQIPPKGQAKLVSVFQGAVLDVVLDLRINEPTFGKYFSIELRGGEYQQLFIPEGFAHGFFVLEDDTVFSYKCSNYYSPEHERCIRWNDPALNIHWPSHNPIVSGKDQEGMSFSQYSNEFL